MKTKNILATLRDLNSLKGKGLIDDYAIGGGIARSYHLEPVFTYDLDVFVSIRDMDAFHRLYEHYRGLGHKIENVYVFVEETPVQFLPAFIHPVIEEGIAEAKEIEVDGMKTKVLSIEYLIATLLMSFRQKDRLAISELLSMADRQLLEGILTRHSSRDYPLSERCREICRYLK